jgi:hypothetical protein
MPPQASGPETWETRVDFDHTNVRTEMNVHTWREILSTHGFWHLWAS